MKHAMAKPKKSWKERLRIFLLVLCSVVFVVSAGMLVYYLLWEPYQHNQKSVEIQQIYPTRGVEDTTSSEEVNSEGTLSKFDELRALNPDIKGWITVPNTPIDYPVLQSAEGEDPEFYLYRDYLKNDDRYGSIFLDASCVNGVNSKNVILHGHNMNDGSQFAAILKYGDLEFYKQNPVIIFDDIYRSGTWKVFAVIKVNTLASQGTPFPYLQGEFIYHIRLSVFCQIIVRRKHGGRRSVPTGIPKVMETASGKLFSFRFKRIAPFLPVHTYGNLSCPHNGFFFPDFHMDLHRLGMLGADRLLFIIAFMMPCPYRYHVFHRSGEFQGNGGHIQGCPPGADISHRGKHPHSSRDFLHIICL